MGKVGEGEISIANITMPLESESTHEIQNILKLF